MYILFSAVSIIFIGLIIAAALTFGFVILLWIFVALMVFTILTFLRDLWRRWWFVHNNAPPKQNPPQKAPQIIEAEYTDISDHTDVK